MKVILLCLVALAYAKAKSTADVSTQTFRYILKEAEKLQSEKRELNNGRPSCPLARYHDAYQPVEAEKSGYSVSEVKKALDVMRSLGFTEETINSAEMQEEIKRQTTTPVCRSDTSLSCDTTATYRAANGTCNNLANPYWGSTGVDQRRILDADYDNNSDINSMRNSSSDGTRLPNPRRISNRIHRITADRKSPSLTLHVFQMGQFVDHDITLTPERHDHDDCCANANDEASCIPIFIQRDQADTHFQSFMVEGYCMNVRRSEESGCDQTTRQQISGITSFIDASNVYGSTQAAQDSLRDTGTGKMLVSNNRLPSAGDGNCELNNQPNQDCSAAGDHRVNIVPSLTAYHHLWVFEHNRIADLLDSSYNDKEVLFQETRRILVGVMQRIIYNEFLPSFMSSEAINHYKLSPSETYAYDDSLDATMSNGFGIAYRIGHTWIPRTMDNFNKAFAPIEGNRTDDSYFDLYLYNKDYTTPALAGPDALALWLTGENSAETDAFMEEAVRSHLLRNETTQTEFDLAALNINRGRDHGLPGYLAYRVWCGEEFGETISVTSWDDLRALAEIPDNVINRLENLYSGPEDIDLFVGAMAEIQNEDFGPTANCILGDQFNRLKFGDRFFYQNPNSPRPFTPGEIAAINDYTMSKVLCNNFDFNTIDENAFVSGTKVDCNSLTDLDINPFLPSSAARRMGASKKELLKEELELREVKLIEELLTDLKDEK